MTKRQYQRNKKLSDDIRKAGEAIDLPFRDHRAGNVYMRLLDIPKGVGVVGQIHKKEHIFAVIRGIVVIEDSGEQQHITAPAFFTVKPGAQRVIYALTDATLMNVHDVPECITTDKVSDYLTTENPDLLPEELH